MTENNSPSSERETAFSKSEIISTIFQELQNASDDFGRPAIQKLKDELGTYISTVKYVPKQISCESLESVRRTQAGLRYLQGNLDRVIAVHFSIRDRIDLLNSLEIRLKSELIRLGFIPKKASGVAQSLIMTSIFPEVQEALKAWNDLEKQCSLVQKNLQEAKDTVKLQTKLDDNVRWSQSKA